jgi:hypothetical protein
MLRNTNNDYYRKRVKEENNFRAQFKPNNNFHPPRSNNYEQRPFSPHNQVNQIENENNSIAESDFPQRSQYSQQSQFNERTFERGGFSSRGTPRGGREEEEHH